uniref:Uncharacterized protein n=1 Tax=Trichogramma kaykai TaxID=54128 RepID=A0ABD2XKL1_9HYME
MEIFYKVSEGIDVMVELYRIMDEYQYKIGLGRFIANINARGSQAVVSGNNNLDKAVNDLMSEIQNNVLMQRYKVATGGVKRNVFPFAHAFFGYYNLPNILKTSKHNDDIITYFLSLLEQIKK